MLPKKSETVTRSQIQHRWKLSDRSERAAILALVFVLNFGYFMARSSTPMGRWPTLAAVSALSCAVGAIYFVWHLWQRRRTQTRFPPTVPEQNP